MHVSLAVVLRGQLIMVAYSKQILLDISFRPTVINQTRFKECHTVSVMLGRVDFAHALVSGLLFWTGFFYEDKAHNCRVKQLTELLLKRNWPVCLTQDCKA